MTMPVKEGFAAMPARCTGCGREWVAVVGPVMAGEQPPILECPACGKMTGLAGIK